MSTINTETSRPDPLKYGAIGLNDQIEGQNGIKIPDNKKLEIIDKLEQSPSLTATQKAYLAAYRYSLVLEGYANKPQLSPPTLLTQIEEVKLDEFGTSVGDATKLNELSQLIQSAREFLSPGLTAKLAELMQNIRKLIGQQKEVSLDIFLKSTQFLKEMREEYKDLCDQIHKEIVDKNKELLYASVAGAAGSALGGIHILKGGNALTNRSMSGVFDHSVAASKSWSEASHETSAIVAEKDLLAELRNTQQEFRTQTNNKMDEMDNALSQIIKNTTETNAQITRMTSWGSRG